jgi:hypothetical protein
MLSSRSFSDKTYLLPMFVCVEAILQNESWPFGVLSRIQGVAFNKRRAIWQGGYKHKKVYVRVVRFGAFVTIGFGQCRVQANSI